MIKKLAIPYHKPSNTQIDKAGEILKKWDYKSVEFNQAVDLIGARRIGHMYPLNTFQATLRKKVRELWLTGKVIISQRLKRLDSIIKKIQRIPGMQLSSMQDIGWLRIVVPKISDVYRLKEIYREGKFRHELKKTNDYIMNPKVSWYRSVHLIYKYNNTKALEYNWLFIELQIRTKLQHARATAVEIVGAFSNQALKASDWDQEILHYFKLVSVLFSHKENTRIPEEYAHHSIEDILNEIIILTEKLDIISKLHAYRMAIQYIGDHKYKKRKTCLISVSWNIIDTTFYEESEIDKANSDYIAKEKEALQNKSQVVLVSLADIKQIQTAYPNYFADTEEFINELLDDTRLTDKFLILKLLFLRQTNKILSKNYQW